MNNFGWFDLNIAFFLPNKIAEGEQRVNSHFEQSWYYLKCLWSEILAPFLAQKIEVYVALIHNFRI